MLCRSHTSVAPIRSAAANCRNLPFNRRDRAAEKAALRAEISGQSSQALRSEPAAWRRGSQSPGKGEWIDRQQIAVIAKDRAGSMRREKLAKRQPQKTTIADRLPTRRRSTRLKSSVNNRWTNSPLILQTEFSFETYLSPQILCRAFESKSSRLTLERVG